MAKVKSILKTLGPIALILGALFFLSQSKKVNIFRPPAELNLLELKPPDRNTINLTAPVEFIPLKYTALIPQFFGLEPTEKFITAKFGELYKKETIIEKLPKQVASAYRTKYPTGEKMTTSYTPLFQYE